MSVRNVVIQSQLLFETAPPGSTLQIARTSTHIDIRSVPRTRELSWKTAMKQNYLSVRYYLGMKTRNLSRGNQAVTEVTAGTGPARLTSQLPGCTIHWCRMTAIFLLILSCLYCGARSLCTRSDTRGASLQSFGTLYSLGSRMVGVDTGAFLEINQGAPSDIEVDVVGFSGYNPIHLQCTMQLGIFGIFSACQWNRTLLLTVITARWLACLCYTRC